MVSEKKTLNRRAFMKGFVRSAAALCTAAALFMGTGFNNEALAAEKKSFRMAWSIYAGWMPGPMRSRAAS